MKQTALGLAGLSAFVAVWIVFNTTRLAALARREEFEICSLVGATGLFVRMPFYVMSLLQGSLSAGFAVVVLTFGVLTVKRICLCPWPWFSRMGTLSIW